MNLETEGWWGGSAGRSGGLPLRMSSVLRTWAQSQGPTWLKKRTKLSSCPLPANLHMSVVVSVHTQAVLCPPHEHSGVCAHIEWRNEWTNEWIQFPYKWTLRWKACPELFKLARWTHHVPRKNRCWDCEQIPYTSLPSLAPSPLSLNSSPSTLISCIFTFY